MFTQHVGARAPLIATLAFAAALGGCAAGRGGNVPYVDAGTLARPDVEVVAPIPINQTINPQDVIEVTIFQVEALSGEHTVDLNGAINMPLIGKVQASGKTAEQLSADLQTRLGQRYLRNPNVQVSLKKLNEQTVTVDGAVQAPGVFPMRGGTTLMKAVAMARGLNPAANPRRVVIFRQINGQRNAAAFDLRAIRRAEAEDPAVYGNDIVIVDDDRVRGWWSTIIGALPLVATFRPY